MDLLAQPHLFQRLLRPFLTLRPADAGDRKRQFHICQNGLMRDQIVTLKHEADRMVPIGIPVPVFIFFCRDPVDDQVSAVIAVQSANNIQKRRLSRTAWAQNGDEFIIS